MAIRKKNDTLSLFQKLAKNILTPPPDLTVSEWADAYRKLSSESSAEPGQWRTDRAPYQREILDAINDPIYEEIVIMSSAQVGKSEILLNAVGYHIDFDPAPILLIQPTEQKAKDFSKERLAPMLRDSPTLRNKVSDVKTRDGGNTVLQKSFPGGYIALGGANAPAGLASRPIRILLADEIDRFPVSAGTEGDPLSLAVKRTNNFYNRKKIFVSTPTNKGASRIEAEFDTSTKETYHIPCPSCGEYQSLKWGQIDFESSYHRCIACGFLHSKYEWDLLKGKWVAENPTAKIRGFHLNELLSPWRKWEEIIDDFKDAKKKGPEALKVWVNTSLGETWEEKGDGVEPDGFFARREEYGCDVPDEAVVLTAGVDVQDNRLEYEIVGWGIGKESWGIKYGVIMGDPGQDFVWETLDQILESKLTRDDGVQLEIMSTCIDSGGHHTKKVYDYCKKREFKRVWAIKGKGGSGIPYVQRPKKRNDEGVWLFSIGVDVGKDVLVSRLKSKPMQNGYCHFPLEEEKGYDIQYFDGLTSEHRVIRFTHGQSQVRWEKKTSGARNEPFDLRNYATAALEILNPPLESLQKQLNQQEKEAQKPQPSVKKRTGVVNRGITV